MMSRGLIALSTVLLLGCGDYENNLAFDATAVVTGSSSVKVGATVQLTATVEFKGKSGPTGPEGFGVFWTSSNDAIATVSPKGLVTGIAAGAVIITATPFMAWSSGPRTPGTLAMTVVP